MRFQAWLQSADGEEVSVVADMDVADARKLEDKLAGEKRQGVLADFYVLEHLETTGTAFEEIEDFLQRSREQCSRA